MGGDLNQAPQGRAPTFLVAALKDPIGANLDRIQIIKGWLDGKGETHEKVYDVAWSGDRKPDAKGKLPPWATPWMFRTRLTRNTIGASELIKVWKDPEFEPRSALSTTCACWKFRLPGGRPTMPSISASRCRRKFR